MPQTSAETPVSLKQLLWYRCWQCEEVYTAYREVFSLQYILAHTKIQSREA